MSVIYTPAEVTVSPLFVDGFNNVLTTQNTSISTNALVLTTLLTINTPPNFLNRDGKEFRLKLFLRWIGATASVNKQTRITFDGLQLFDSLLSAISDNNLYIEITVKRLTSTSWRSIGKATFSTIGSAAITASSQEANSQSSFNPAITNSIIVQAQVANAANSVSLDWVTGDLI